jgi:PAS domain S-box-containing protein
MDKLPVFQTEAEVHPDLLRAIIDACPVPISVFAAPGERLIHNRRAQQLSSAAAVDFHFDDVDITHSDGTPYTSDQYPIARGLRGETVIDEEFFSRWSGELRRYVSSVAPILDGEGAVIAAVSIWDDVTERRMVEKDRQELLESLDESRRLFAGIAEATPDIIYLFDVQEGRAIYENARMIPILGYKPVEFNELMLIDALIHPDDRAAVHINLQAFETLNDGEILEFEYRMKHKRGGYLWFLTRGVVFARNNADGRPRVVLGLAQDITQRKEAEAALRQAHVELELRVAERTEQLVRAQEAERHRIARELHDELGQHVSALKVGLEALRDHSANAKRVQQLTDLVVELDRDVDRLAHELRPPALEDLGLEVALANYIEQFTERSNIPVDFHGPGFTGERLPLVIEMTLYRVVQEALTNILKHAHASNVSVILETRDGQIQLIVEDDGSGFDSDVGTKRGLGFIGMKERVALAGGRLSVESNAGGTSVFVRLTI